MSRVEVIGDATLILGDCREVLPTLGRFDLLLTDPPYGIGITKSHRLATSRGLGGMSWDDAPPSDELISACVAAADAAIVWGGNYFALPPSRCFLVWDKQNDGRDFADCEKAWTNLSAVARIFRMRPMNMDGGKVHPTQKPLRLMEWCLQQAGNPRSVLDPFAGSFSTGVACIQRGIPFVGIEREPRYFEAGLKRIEQAARQGRLFAPDPPPAPVQPDVFAGA